ncbi:MAG: leucine-rich repeat protein, partial [Clostridia bacterium]|nr:leucine-rich repeat protein [Clostridia bacterium]
VVPTNADNQNISWSVSAPSVVQMNETAPGKVHLTGLQAGSAVLSATSQDGGITREIGVNVFGSLAVSAEPRFTVNTAGNDLKWTLNIQNAIDTLGYSIRVTSGGQTVYTASAYDAETGVVVPGAAIGMYTLEVTVTDGDGETAQAESTVEVSDRVLYSENGFVWSYVIVNAQGSLGASVKLESCPDGTTAITVPAVMNQAPVVRIDTEAFLNQSALTQVTIPATVTEIGARAFKGCASLTSLITE